MITDVVIQDYQAVREARLRLKRFTVITGPTGSGKSAVIRAIKLVVFNARGTSYVRHGAKACAAMVGFEGEYTAVAIHRGGRGADKYRVSTIDTSPHRHTNDPAVQEYTKLAGAVPEQVSAVLRLGELNFAGQFDRPYLLDASGSQVARVLGELTDVTLVLDAAREATRRKLETSRELRRAEQELASLTAQAQQFRGLRARRDALVDADELLHSASLISDSVERLRQLSDMHQKASQECVAALVRVQAMAVPSLDRAVELRASLTRLRALAEEWDTFRKDIRGHEAAAENCRAAEEQAHRQLHEILVAAGACPTCGQRVPGLCSTARSAASSMAGPRAWPGALDRARCAVSRLCATTCPARA